IERLREYLMTEVRFSQPGAGALSLLETGARSRRGSFIGSEAAALRPPRLLPYLTDRHEQQPFLTSKLQAALDQRANRPITFVPIGSADDCVDSFVEQVRYVRLPAILEANGLAPDVLYRRLQWPSPDMQTGLPNDSVEYLFEDVKAQVYDTLAVKVTADK